MERFNRHLIVMRYTSLNKFAVWGIDGASIDKSICFLGRIHYKVFESLFAWIVSDTLSEIESPSDHSH